MIFLKFWLESEKLICAFDLWGTADLSSELVDDATKVLEFLLDFGNFVRQVFWVLERISYQSW